MEILVDADACPNVIKEIIFRAATRTETLTTLFANQFINIPHSPFIKMVKVGAGFDVADDKIVELAKPGDLIITADIPLAALVVNKDALALNPRGTLYTKETIADHLATRNLMTELRDTGIITGGPSGLTKSHRQAFANALDRIITKYKNR